MMVPILFTLIFAAHAYAQSEFISNPIRLHSDGVTIPFIDCLSWRWAVETNNDRNWAVVPSGCVSYVAEYMDAKPRPGKDTQYRSDIYTLFRHARKHLTKCNPAHNGKDIWVFDLDETLLSDLPYYRRPDVNFGEFPFNRTKFYEWIATGELPPIRPLVKLYNDVLEKGFKIVIISGTSEDFRETRVKNLHNAGVYKWEKLILRKKSERGISALKYKSAKRTELVNEGYKIIGNIGDQWSDLLGPHPGERTFKVPNPMYYVR